MKDFKELIDEIDLENISGGLAGGQIFADQIRPLLAQKLLAEGYTLSLVKEKLLALPLSDKIALAKALLPAHEGLVDEKQLVDGKQLVDEKQLADELTRVLGRCFE